jgi:hypothetical protein
MNKAINDVDRENFFTNFNPQLLKQIRIIKQYTKIKENEYIRNNSKP